MNTVTGDFTSLSNAEAAVKALINERFADDDIGIVVRDNKKGESIAHDMGRSYTKGPGTPDDIVTNRTMVFDHLPSAFVDQIHRAKMPDEATDWYKTHLDRGDILVIVKAGNRMDDAAHIIRNNGGELYHHEERAMPRGEGVSTMPQGEVRLPVVDEEVMVEKSKHQVGEVRVTSDTTSETVEVPTSIVHEEIHVERRTLDHPMTPDEYKGSTTEQGVIRMPIIEEEVRVSKTPVVREELIVTRMPVTEQQTIRESVMHAEPHVETTGDVEVHEERPGMTEEERKRRPAA